MIANFFKRNSVLLAFFGVYLLVVAIVLLEIDKQYYQMDKVNYLLESVSNGTFYTEQLSGIREDKLQEISNEAIVFYNSGSAQIRDRLWQKANEIVQDKKNIIWQITLRPIADTSDPVNFKPREGYENLAFEFKNDKKIKEFNTSSNSLFLRDFSKMMSMLIQDRGKKVYRLFIHYTTPVNNTDIQELTIRYRWIAGFAVLGLTLLFGAVARVILFPLRNVVSAIERSGSKQTLFISRPHSRLEHLYNRMALGAVIARLQGQLRDEIALRPQMTSWEVVRFVCLAFREQVGVPLVGCLEMVAEGPGSIRATGQHVIVHNQYWPMGEDDLAQLFDQLLPRDGRAGGRFTLTEFKQPRECELAMTADSERTGIRYLFALALDGRAPESMYVSLQYLMSRLTSLVESGLQTLSMRNQLLVQERGRANISLSRNLGHDLTNIIATSKLELIALEKLLEGGQAPTNPGRRILLSESLQGLLRSVRFMQETVNLYRAYAFLQHPILEMQDGSKLVGETLDLFALSVSAKVELQRELAADAPRCVVDQRLIKLALFNVFANALEAIRKLDPDRQVRGWIKVITRRSKEGGLCIAVEDSGTGILNSAGLRAAPHEIEKIFDLGYTSRRAGGQQGEGLGLNWVRTIIQDLHGGSIFAENMEFGGARFILTFPPPEADSGGDSETVKAPEALDKVRV